MTDFAVVHQGVGDISTHTPARGVTNAYADFAKQIKDFYSHAREGRDGSAAESETEAAISTHTPARGVTH